MAVVTIDISIWIYDQVAATRKTTEDLKPSQNATRYKLGKAF